MIDFVLEIRMLKNMKTFYIIDEKRNNLIGGFCYLYDLLPLLGNEAIQTNLPNC